MIDVQTRINQINNGLAALSGFGWAFIEGEIDARISELTEALINNDNEQTRGRIKQLQDIKNMPVTLQAERDWMLAALPDTDAAE